MMVMRLRYMVLSQYRPASYLLSLILPSLLTGALCRWPLVSGLPVALLSLLLCMLALPWCFPIGRQSTPAWLIPNRTLWPALALLHHLMVTLLSLGMCAVVVHLFHPQLPFDLTVLKPLWPIWALWTGFRLLLESRMGQDGRALALLPLMVLCTLPFGFDILKPVQNLPPITAVVAVALIALALIPVPAQLLRPKTEGDTP